MPQIFPQKHNFACDKWLFIDDLTDLIRNYAPLNICILKSFTLAMKQNMPDSLGNSREVSENLKKEQYRKKKRKIECHNKFWKTFCSHELYPSCWRGQVWVCPLRCVSLSCPVWVISNKAPSDQDRCVADLLCITNVINGFLNALMAATEVSHD